MIGGAGREHVFYCRFQDGAVLQALLVGREVRVAAPFRVAEGRGAALPDRLAGSTDHQIPVLGPHALVGRVLAVARTLPGRLLAVGEPLRRCPRTETDRGLQQRAFDEPALAGALALVEGGEDALHGPHAGAEIADRQPDRSRRAVGLAGYMHDAAHPLGDQVEAAAPGSGPVIAEPESWA